MPSPQSGEMFIAKRFLLYFLAPQEHKGCDRGSCSADTFRSYRSEDIELEIVAVNISLRWSEKQEL